MKIRHKLAAATAALGLAVAAAAPAQASTISRTYDARTNTYYSYSDSVNMVCYQKSSNRTAQARLSVQIKINGRWYTRISALYSDTRLHCFTLRSQNGFYEGRSVRLIVSDNRGSSTTRYFYR
ncbi:hypothetical protein ACEUE7_05060 [Micrococcus endophyticus]|uniref:hypothetical protein n=1 Tax=Micrococcus endophyticus TaxID=455343 RepID=UPI0035A97C49